jgi:hypothetical protein
MSEGKFSTGEMAKTFALAGKARLTLVSEKTGARFTYRISRKDETTPWFVSLLSGSDNENDFAYLGTIFSDGAYRHGRKSRIGSETPSARAFAWAWGFIARGELPTSCEVWHEGRCGCCGRVLTVPESIESGFGPVCGERVAA